MDVIDLSDIGAISTLNAFRTVATQSGANHTIRFQDATLCQFDQSDFIF